MISRCPSCGAPAPDEARQCPACGWDFVTNKKSGQKPEPGAEKPKSPAPSAAVPALPPARLPKVELRGFSAPAAPDENPFALPVAQPSLSEARPKEAAPPESAPAKAPAGRQSGVYLAMLAGGALGLCGVGAIFMMLRSEPQGAARPKGSAPFRKRSRGDVTVTPVLDKPAAPVVSKAVEPPKPEPVTTPVSPAPARSTETFAQAVTAAWTVAPKKLSEPVWVFEGTVYDLLSTRGVYGARLVFVDAQGSEVASIETNADGRYRAEMKPGPSEGYALRVVHDDYSGKRIDELDAAGSVRNADLAQRKFLMQAGARSVPWIGAIGKPVRRDMALAPKVSDEVSP